MSINRQRKWNLDGNGHGQHVSAEELSRRVEATLEKRRRLAEQIEATERGVRGGSLPPCPGCGRSGTIHPGAAVSGVIVAGHCHSCSWTPAQEGRLGGGAVATIPEANEGINRAVGRLHEPPRGWKLVKDSSVEGGYQLRCVSFIGTSSSSACSRCGYSYANHTEAAVVLKDTFCRGCNKVVLDNFCGNCGRKAE